MAKYLKTDHHEIIFTEEDAISCIREVIRITESYDLQTVRDSIHMYLLSKYIKEKTDTRCIFSGHGNSEILQGYRYLYNAPTPLAAHEESLKLANDLYLFDLAYADHTTAYNGWTN